jgi:hypothetical protein
VHALTCDLADEEARRRLPGAVADLGLEVSILCNSAGVGAAGDVVTVPAERQVALLRVDLEATVDLCGRFVPGMVRRGSGAVLNVCSLFSVVPMPRMAAYAASKAALLSFTEALHAELRPRGVAVTALCPGTVPTEFMDLAGLGAAVEQVPAWALDDARRVAERGLEALARQPARRRAVGPVPVGGALAAPAPARSAVQRAAAPFAVPGRVAGGTGRRRRRLPWTRTAVLGVTAVCQLVGGRGLRRRG